MPFSEELRAVGDRVRNWGRWGDDDQAGTANLIDDGEKLWLSLLIVPGVIFGSGVMSWWRRR